MVNGGPTGIRLDRKFGKITVPVEVEVWNPYVLAMTMQLAAVDTEDMGKLGLFLDAANSRLIFCDIDGESNPYQVQFSIAPRAIINALMPLIAEGDQRKIAHDLGVDPDDRNALRDMWRSDECAEYVLGIMEWKAGEAIRE